eukprot:TRINITY_DN15102_c0_g1_i1.p1 TRINITY_DN15102_c0_g1~~TRINITY_DN15102_c0_g1_i1.p1  ORF type:complete len:705 (-),score=97.88 TRINITY_DN15102_c0_g1_i1:87-2201(-)
MGAGASVNTPQHYPSSLVAPADDARQPQLFYQRAQQDPLDSSAVVRCPSRNRDSALSNASRKSSLRRRSTSDFRFGVSPYTEKFDKHFDIRSDSIDDNILLLQSEILGDTVVSIESSSDESVVLQEHPECWGIKLRFISKLLDYIADDMRGYAGAHCLDCLDEQWKHVCLTSPCTWTHADATLTEMSNAGPNLQPIRANMHLVVQRYIMPWTQIFPRAGLALALNAGWYSERRRKNNSAKHLCTASVFISHSWGDLFEDFVQTLKTNIHEETVVWVCSFAVPQHAKINSMLSELILCPFTVALRSACRILVVMSEDAAVFTRCWCVLEAVLAWKWEKDYDLSLPDDGEMRVWKAVSDSLNKIDLEQCSATISKDKDMILAFARTECGSISNLNDMVRTLGKCALERSKLITAAATGDIGYLQKRGSKELLEWRNASGRTLLHIAAKSNSVHALVQLATMTGQALLDSEDSDGRTPVSIAAESGALGSICALISYRANIELCSKGNMLTPLHFAAMVGRTAVASALMEARAQVEAEGQYRGAPRRPLHIATREGHSELVQDLLVRGHADVDACCSDGTRALFLAARKGRAEVAERLIRARADINLCQPDDFRRTALMAAVESGSISTASLLIAYLANPYLKDANGEDSYRCLTRMDIGSEAHSMGDAHAMTLLLQRAGVIHRAGAAVAANRTSPFQSNGFLCALQ